MYYTSTRCLSSTFFSGFKNQIKDFVSEKASATYTEFLKTEERSINDLFKDHKELPERTIQSGYIDSNTFFH